MTSTNLSTEDKAFYQGKLQAAKYFVRWELPTIARDIRLLSELEDTCAAMQEAWF